MFRRIVAKGLNSVQTACDTITQAYTEATFPSIPFPPKIAVYPFCISSDSPVGTQDKQHPE